MIYPRWLWTWCAECGGKGVIEISRTRSNCPDGYLRRRVAICPVCRGACDSYGGFILMRVNHSPDPRLSSWGRIA